MNNFVEIFQESVNLWDGRRIRKNKDVSILFIFQEFVSRIIFQEFEISGLKKIIETSIKIYLKSK